MALRKPLVPAALAVLLFVGASTAQASVILPGFNSSTLAPNDDGSTGLVGIGFTLSFNGVDYTDLFVNNNGNVTFNFALSTFTPFAITGGSLPMLAPFFGDVDTRSAGDPVTYGGGSVDGHQAFGVNWVNVDYFASSATHTNRNSFQLVIVNRSDISAGDFDFFFNYDLIQWEAGTASGSSAQGCGGTSAHVGWTNGAGSFFEFAGSGVNGAFIDSGTCGPAGPNALTQHTFGVGDDQHLGRYGFQVRSGVVETPVPEPATMVLVGSGLAAIIRGARRKARS